MSRREPVIGVVGLGYVGLAYALGFSMYGFRVVGVDIDGERVKSIKNGLVNGFSGEVLLKVVQDGSLKVSTSYEVLGDADVVFITVNTPTKHDGSQDLSQVVSALESLAKVWRDTHFDYRIIVLKSTVLPGTTRALAEYARHELGLPIPDRLGFAHSPEFLRADRALEDVLRPFRVVVGGVDERSTGYIAGLFRDFYRRVGYEPPIYTVSLEEAELVKYASNVFLAMKTVYGNLIGLICRQIDNCDAWRVMSIVGLDPRIGRSHILPGMPYGGPCLIKDILAFGRFMLEKTGLDFVKRIHDYNELVIEKVTEHLDSELSGLQGRKIVVLGVSYKPGSPDIKDSPSIKLCEKLLSKNAIVYIHDVNREAVEKAKAILSGVIALETTEKLKEVDAVIVTLGYNEYKLIPPDVYDNALVIDMTGEITYEKAHRFYTSNKLKTI
ncbi:MAG: nucleotide sugar dehydrogenase [Desulfurococcales archaeon]|nr:nucleotide sugar dehydrogenase [Desulfurococcales archaeon]